MLVEFAFWFGVLYIALLVPLNILTVSVLNFFKVKVTSFSVSYPLFEKVLHKITINKTDYKLGYLPFIVIKEYLGSSQEDEKLIGLSDDEKSMAFYNKTKMQKRIILNMNNAIWTLNFLICVYFIKPSARYLENMVHIVMYFLNVIRALFNFYPKEEFLQNSKELANNYNLIPVILIIMIGSTLVLGLINKISTWLFLSKENILKKILYNVLIFGSAFILVWKIPSFIAHFVGWGYLLKCLFSYFLAIYLCGFTYYWLVILFVKWKAKTNS